MLSIFAAIQRANRVRLQRRRDTPPGPLARMVHRIRAWNRERLSRLRARRQLISALVANDTAVLEALVFLLRTAREEQRARAEAHASVMERLSTLEKRLGLGENAPTVSPGGNGADSNLPRVP